MAGEPEWPEDDPTAAPTSETMAGEPEWPEDEPTVAPTSETMAGEPEWPAGTPTQSGGSSTNTGALTQDVPGQNAGTSSIQVPDRPAAAGQVSRDNDNVPKTDDRVNLPLWWGYMAMAAALFVLTVWEYFETTHTSRRSRKAQNEK